MHDNTTRHGDQLFQMDADLISMVREGMQVQDVQGRNLGTVERVKMGDPEAVTTQGATSSRPHDLVTDAVIALFGDVDVQEPKRSQLLRYGFLRIDGSGLTDTDRFVRADKIKQVMNDTVTLAVTKDQLVEEA